MSHVFFVALGGALGASARYYVGVAAFRFFGPGFPYGTLIVNVLGSFAMGLLIAFLAKRSGTAAEWRVFLATGVLGGFTTFSAFSLDAVELWERGAIGSAGLYIAGSVTLSILALMAGLMLVRAAH
ncbi:MAG: fluoride efflux transporter CrcB [Pseudomonadota bacterium]